MASLKFQEEVVVGFKDVDDPETAKTGFTRVFFNRDVGGLTPARGSDVAKYNDVHEW